jgi:hypothetical protein
VIRKMSVIRKDIDHAGEPECLTSIREKYGELLDLRQIADFFKYPSVQAVRKAHQRGTLPVPLHRFPRKNGYFAKATDVAKSIDMMVDVALSPTGSSIS